MSKVAYHTTFVYCFTHLQKNIRMQYLVTDMSVFSQRSIITNKHLHEQMPLQHKVQQVCNPWQLSFCSQGNNMKSQHNSLIISQHQKKNTHNLWLYVILEILLSLYLQPTRLPPSKVLSCSVTMSTSSQWLEWLILLEGRGGVWWGETGHFT